MDRGGRGEGEKCNMATEQLGGWKWCSSNVFPLVQKLGNKRKKIYKPYNQKISTYQTKTPPKHQIVNISGTAGRLQMTLAPLESPDRVGLESRKAKHPAKI